MTTSEIVDSFRKLRPKYESFTSKLEQLLRDLLHVHDIPATVEARTKTVDSFEQKICRPGKSYDAPLEQISDLSGLRIITRTTQDVARVERMLSSEFAIDRSRSVDKAAELDPTHFGYLSKHFIVRLDDRRKTSEWRSFESLVAEVQVRTFVQHAWANVQRALEYTRENDIPTPLRRRLYRLSALFELADDELEQIWRACETLNAEYQLQVREDRAVELNLDSYRIFLEQSSQVAEIVSFLESLGARIDPPGMISRDHEVMRRAGFRTVTDIANLLDSTKSWSKRFFEDFMMTNHASALAQRALSFHMNGVVLFLVIAAHPEIFSARVLETECGFGKPEQILSAASRNRRA